MLLTFSEEKKMIRLWIKCWIYLGSIRPLTEQSLSGLPDFFLVKNIKRDKI
jgi:hypothetical protein